MGPFSIAMLAYRAYRSVNLQLSPGNTSPLGGHSQPTRSPVTVQQHRPVTELPGLAGPRSRSWRHCSPSRGEGQRMMPMNRPDTK